MTPTAETIAFRIWSHCAPRGWQCTLAETAAALDLPLASVRYAVRAKRWYKRFSPHLPEYYAALAATQAREALGLRHV